MQLNEFEKHIDEKILKRGESYFKNGHVGEIEEISSGTFEVIVEGSEDYLVELTVENGEVKDFSCDCPYDAGPICKHVAAALFSLRENSLKSGMKSSSASSNKSSGHVKKKTVEEQVRELLEKVDHDELKQFVMNLSLNDTDFRGLFISSFIHYTTEESKELYKKQIKSVLRSFKDGHGFINRYSSRYAGRAVDNFLETAQKQIETGDYKNAVLICTALIEEMTAALQYSDDSDGGIANSISYALGMFAEISSKPESEDVRKLLLDYCFYAYDKKIFEGWDWHLDMLWTASNLIKTDDETEELFQRLEKHTKSKYEEEELQQIMYEVLLKKNKDEAEKYLDKHMKNSDLRKKAIQNALNSKNFEKAEQFALDGIDYDKKEKPGLVRVWNQWLLKIARAKGDKEKVVYYARSLFIDNFGGEEDYYLILKRNINRDSWISFVEEMIKEINQKTKWDKFNLIAGIYKREQWWDKLFELVKKSPYLDVVESYEKYLVNDYSEEIVQMYADGIMKYLENNVGKNHYITACRYIRKMLVLGAKEKSHEIIEYLKNKYSNRPALQKELSKLL